MCDTENNNDNNNRPKENQQSCFKRVFKHFGIVISDKFSHEPMLQF